MGKTGVFEPTECNDSKTALINSDNQLQFLLHERKRARNCIDRKRGCPEENGANMIKAYIFLSCISFPSSYFRLTCVFVCICTCTCICMSREEKRG